jgi:hypothetical protein
MCGFHTIDTNSDQQTLMDKEKHKLLGETVAQGPMHCCFVRKRDR